MKERRKIVGVGLAIASFLMLLDLFINYRMHCQLNGIDGGIFLSDNFKYVSRLVFIIFGYFGVATTLFVLKLFIWFLLVTYTGHAPYNPDGNNHISTRLKLTVTVITISFFFVVFFSPFQSYFIPGFSLNFWSYAIILFGLFVLALIYYSRIGRTFCFFPDGEEDSSSNIGNDPFGKLERVFPQVTDKIEDKYSVNIKYEFLTKKGMVTGWLNILNHFRGVLIMGVPGSGKSFGTFLAAIYQMTLKGYTMLIYDFKFKELTEYAYHCYLERVKGSKPGEKIPEFGIISLENTMYSERCNVFQPHIMNDFVVDTVGLIKAFFIALNPSWKNKEGDFFPESAINVASAGTWGLKIYEPLDGRPKGSMCSLPHLIEFMSQDVESIIKMLVKLKDQSLVNIIKPFEEAQRDGALEQLQGQMGTVRITLSRLTSPKLYYMLTEPLGSEPFDLNINSKNNPKILSLANSGQNQGVNNIVLSLFIVQIFRFINKKHQNPCGVMLDEAVTLSFPKGTLDTIIATGRSNLISTWVGIQDKAQLVRDLGKDAAESVIKMLGNLISGTVYDDTAEMISKRIGDIRVVKKTTNVSVDGERSYSYAENTVRAVPEGFISRMSQGTMCGQIADSYDEKNDLKSFFGDIKFEHPFKTKKVIESKVLINGKPKKSKSVVYEDMDMPKLPYSKYWSKVIDENCKGMAENEVSNYVDKLMQENFKQVVLDIATMRSHLLGEPLDESAILKSAEQRMDQGEHENKVWETVQAERDEIVRREQEARDIAANQVNLDTNVVFSDTNESDGSDLGF